MTSGHSGKVWTTDELVAMTPSDRHDVGDRRKRHPRAPTCCYHPHSAAAHVTATFDMHGAGTASTRSVACGSAIPYGAGRTAPRRRPGGARPRGPRPGDRDPYSRSPPINTLETTLGEALTREAREHIMALTNKSRTAIYNGLTDIIEEEALEEMLTNFPAREIDEPVTRDYLAAQFAQLEGRIQDRFATQTRWMVGMIVAIPPVTVALQAYFT